MLLTIIAFDSLLFIYFRLGRKHGGCDGMRELSLAARQEGEGGRREPPHHCPPSHCHHSPPPHHHHWCPHHRMVLKNVLGFSV